MEGMPAHGGHSFMQQMEIAMTMIESPMPAGDPVPTAPPMPGKTQPIPPEMPVPAIPGPEDAPPQPSHPCGPPSPTA
jgi:hypothetical protein